MGDLKTLTTSRGVMRSSATNLLKTVKPIIEQKDASQLERDDIEIHLSSLNDKKQELKALDHSVALLTEEHKLDDELQKSAEYEFKLSKAIYALKTQ